MRKIILKNTQSPGDILCFSRAVAEIKETFPDWKIDVRSPCNEIFENSPRITKLDDADPTVEIITLENKWVHQSGGSGIHFAEGYVREAEEKLKVPLKRTGLRPELWISDLEKSWINQVQTAFGYRGKFWVINAGYKSDCWLKYYPFWKEVAKLLKDKIQLVQVGHEDHIHPNLEDEGVLNLIGKTDLRELIRLMYHAEGTIGPISFQMHVSAAFMQPAVVVAGGKEPVRWEYYPNHQYLAVNGCLKCARGDGCWKAKKEDCVNLVGRYPRCYVMIKPEQVAQAVLNYYDGGYLSYG